MCESPPRRAKLVEVGAEGANPPRNLSGKRTTWVGSSGGARRQRGRGCPCRLSGSPLMSDATFANRHIGPSSEDVSAMLTTVGYGSIDELVDAAVPETIRRPRTPAPPPPAAPAEAIAAARRPARPDPPL